MEAAAAISVDAVPEPRSRRVRHLPVASLARAGALGAAGAGDGVVWLLRRPRDPKRRNRRLAGDALHDGQAPFHHLRTLRDVAGGRRRRAPSSDALPLVAAAGALGDDHLPPARLRAPRRGAEDRGSSGGDGAAAPGDAERVRRERHRARRGLSVHERREQRALFGAAQGPRCDVRRLRPAAPAGLPGARRRASEREAERDLGRLHRRGDRGAPRRRLGAVPDAA